MSREGATPVALWGEEKTKYQAPRPGKGGQPEPRLVRPLQDPYFVTGNCNKDACANGGEDLRGEGCRC
jgi:hypothetical protein